MKDSKEEDHRPLQSRMGEGIGPKAAMKRGGGDQHQDQCFKRVPIKHEGNVKGPAAEMKTPTCRPRRSRQIKKTTRRKRYRLQVWEGGGGWGEIFLGTSTFGRVSKGYSVTGGMGIGLSLVHPKKMASQARGKQLSLRFLRGGT